MGKGLEGWTVRNLLMVSVALNVWLILRLTYEKEGSNYLTTQENMLNGVCVNNKHQVVSSSLLSSVVAHKDNNFIVEDDLRVINLDHGDPTMYEKYWQQIGDKTAIVISGWQSMSYFSDFKNLCWFLEPQLAEEIVRVHKIVGNAVTEGRHIVVGTGSTQLFQAALYALSYGGTEPISVLSATPYYSFYRQVVEYMKSGLYKWDGDVSNHVDNKPYIELITSPNNPDGFIRQPIINRSGGMLIHDFAYYWPQYTPITSPADHDIMLFTLSKSTGHAGLRIGWALVKDREVAKRMTKFIELSSIGVSKDSQLRAAKILQAVSDSCDHDKDFGDGGNNFFEMSYRLIAERWKRLREAVEQSRMFSIPEFPLASCNFTHRTFRTQPAFAWLKCEDEIEDCESFLRNHKILTRSGKQFGMSPKYVRVSMLDRDSNYDLFIKRLLTMSS